jgi:hypothetical protein
LRTYGMLKKIMPGLLQPKLFYCNLNVRHYSTQNELKPDGSRCISTHFYVLLFLWLSVVYAHIIKLVLLSLFRACFINAIMQFVITLHVQRGQIKSLNFPPIFFLPWPNFDNLNKLEHRCVCTALFCSRPLC